MTVVEALEAVDGGCALLPRVETDFVNANAFGTGRIIRIAS